MGNFLTSREVEILKEGHRAAQNKRQADRIKTILLLDVGFEYGEIARILLLDDSSLRRYYEEYTEYGIDGLLEDQYQGGKARLSGFQEVDLIAHLTSVTYQKAQGVIRYIEEHYGIRYTVEGVTHLLHRLGFVYKKTKQIPGKTDLQKQQAFIKQYEQLKEEKGVDDRIYFVDASHPHHNSMAAYGWIYKGTTKTIKTNTGRERINLNGAINLEGMKIIVQQEETINAAAMIRLFGEMERRQPVGHIYAIVDNARYNHALKVQQYVQEHPRITIIFLPAYSPNLNIIERLWRFFHAEILYNKYYATFAEFQERVTYFFSHPDDYQSNLKSLLTDSFQLLGV